MNKQRWYTFRTVLLIIVAVSCFAQGHDRKRGISIPFLTEQIARDSGAILQCIRNTEQLAPGTSDRAIRILDSVIDRSGRIGYTDAICYAHIAKGNIYFTADSFSLARSHYEEAAAMSGWAYFDREHILARCYISMALVHTMAGANDSAIQCTYKSLAIGKHLSDTLIMTFAYANLAAIWTYQKEPSKTIEYANKALKLAEEGRLMKRLSPIHNSLAAAYGTLEDLERYHYHARSALKYSKEYGGRKEGSTLAWSHLGYYHLKKGDPDSAEYCFRKQLRIADSLQISFMQTEAYRGLGQAFRDMGRHSQAIRYLNIAAGQAERSGSILSTMGADIYLRRADIYRTLGQQEKALNDFIRYDQIDRRLFSQEKNRYTDNLEIRFRTTEKDAELLARKLRISRQQHELKQKNLLILSSAAASVMLLSVLMFLYLGKQQKQKLLLQKLQLQQRKSETDRLRLIMQGEEKERSRLAQELREGVGMHMDAIRDNFRMIRQTDARAKEITGLDEIMDMLEETTSEIRKTAHNLMPDILLRHNLEEALQYYCANVSAADSLHIGLHIRLQDQLGKKLELFLYRILQELIQNIIKHAGATKAFIDIGQSGDLIQAMVEDNGRGFDTGTKANGIGLQTLQSRIRAAGGEISIESAHVGTTIIFRILNSKFRQWQ